MHEMLDMYAPLGYNEGKNRKERTAMSPLHESKGNEHPSTYFVEDRSNHEEMNRVKIQDQMITTRMGGVLPEQTDLTRFPRVLDVGCGTGCWLIELAKTVPTSTLLVGVDTSLAFIQEARAQAIAEQVADRVEFHVMDALRRLEFPNHFFSLVNHRFAASWARTWDWPQLLREYRRVCYPDGMVRVTESDWTGATNCPAFTCLLDLLVKAFHQSGHLFTPTGDGVTSQLESLLCTHGLHQVQTRTSTLKYQPGGPGWQLYFANNQLTFRTGLPFLRKWTQVPDNYEALCQQALQEMQQPDFVATLNIQTAWGKPSSAKDLLNSHLMH